MTAPDELEALREENARLRATLDAVLASRSWRLTRPLRNGAAAWRRHAMRRVLRRIRRHRVWQEDRFLLGVTPSPVPPATPHGGNAAQASVCAIVHAYYVELLPGIVERLLRCRELRAVIVTYPNTRAEGAYSTLLEPLRSSGVAVDLIAVDNRGRDMLPFVLVAQRALDTGCNAFLKLHTKRSPHLGADGAAWRDDLLEGLVASAEAASTAAHLVASNEAFGFAVPVSRLGGRPHRGANGRKVRELARRAGLRVPRNLLFPAGGMYWCSRAWLESVVSLGLTPDDFEPEQGQLDGTTAHALERLIGCFAWTHRSTVWLMGA